MLIRKFITGFIGSMMPAYIGMTQSDVRVVAPASFGVRYSTDGSKVVKVGICFDMTERAVKDWKVCDG